MYNASSKIINVNNFLRQNFLNFNRTINLPVLRPNRFKRFNVFGFL